MDRPFAAYTGDEPYVFVSYSHDNSSVVFPELAWLKESGFNIWYDEGIEAGTEWREELAKAIEEARLLVYFITPESVQSQNCRKEVNFAVDQDIPIIAIHLEKTDLPSGLNLTLSDRQALLKYELPKQEYQQKLQASISSYLDQPIIQPAVVKDKKIVPIMAAVVGLIGLAIGLFFYNQQDVQQNTADPGTVDATPSIAVLPFVNRSAREEDAFFVDGLHDDLLTHISKIGSIKTISRTSVMQYRNTSKTIPQIAKELGVATIMEGGVQRAGDTIRINVQLIDAATDEHLWAQIYDRQLTAVNIFAIQSEIATAIAEALRATLSLDEQQRLAIVPTQSLPALEAYFLGKQRMATRITDNLAEAVDLFQQAIELDPDFALAYVGLADTYLLQIDYTGLPPDEMRTKSELAINKALALDDRLGEAYASLGLLKKGGSLKYIDPQGAETAFKRALELNPNYASAHHWYRILLSNAGRFEEGLAHIKIAVELDPLSGVMNHNLAQSYVNLGRFDEAMAQHKKNIEMNPEYPGAYEGIGTLYWSVYGQLDKAVPWYEKMVALDPRNSTRLFRLGVLFLDLGDDEQAEYWFSRSRELAPDGIFTNFAMAILHAYRGEDDQAAEYANRVLHDDPRNLLLSLLRDRDMQAGRYAEARARYATTFPELLAVNEPEINGSNYGAAINLASILSATGEQERADLLLERSLAYIETIQRLGFFGSGISDVQIYALQGQTAEALAALQQSIDEGWRVLWWYYLKHNKNLDSIRDEPEFQAMVKEIEADMAEQLARVREQQANGELAPIPRSLE